MTMQQPVNPHNVHTASSYFIIYVGRVIVVYVKILPGILLKIQDLLLKQIFFGFNLLLFKYNFSLVSELIYFT